MIINREEVREMKGKQHVDSSRPLLEKALSNFRSYKPRWTLLDRLLPWKFVAGRKTDEFMSRVDAMIDALDIEHSGERK